LLSDTDPAINVRFSWAVLVPSILLLNVIDPVGEEDTSIDKSSVKTTDPVHAIIPELLFWYGVCIDPLRFALSKFRLLIIQGWVDVPNCIVSSFVVDVFSCTWRRIGYFIIAR